MATEASLWWGLFFGSIGLGYFIYGKKQRVVMPLISGIALMIFPYFVSSTLLLVFIGCVLLASPFIFKF